MRHIFILLFVFTCFSVQAQRGYGSPYGNSGRNRSAVPRAGGNQAALEPEKPDANILSAEKGEMYAELLGVDVFTKEVMKNYLKDYYGSLIAIGFDKDMPVEDKRKGVELEKKKLEKNLSSILNEEQVRQIMVEEESGAKSKKYKKEKRKKRKKKEKND